MFVSDASQSPDLDLKLVSPGDMDFCVTHEMTEAWSISSFLNRYTLGP